MGEAKQQAEKAARRPETRGLARWGLVSKGALYVLVGLIAADVVIRHSGRVQDREGALAATADTALGELLVGAVAVGLLGYAVWRFVEGVVGHPLEGGEREGWIKRLGYFAGSLWYLGLFALAIAVLVGTDEASGSRQEDRLTGRVMELPLGRWIVAGVGLGIMGAGAFNLWNGASRRFREQLKVRKMSDTEETAFTAAGVVGHLARGAVFGLIGFFLVRAAWQYDPDEAIGLDGALAKVLRADYGTTLLGAVAAGLIAYGVYCFAEALYREV